jgi:hypothetical protein
MEDKRDILRIEKPFSWKILKNEKAQIFWKKMNIKTISGKQYLKLERLIENGNDYEIQLFLAKITGNFKHGNEKMK